MDYYDNLVEKPDIQTIVESDSQLLEANFQLYELVEQLSRNNKQIEEYNKLLEQKVSELESQKLINSVIFDHIDDAIEIFDSDQFLIYQNDKSRNELDCLQGQDLNSLVKKNQFIQDKIIPVRDIIKKAKKSNEIYEINNQAYEIKTIPITDKVSGDKVIVIRKNLSDPAKKSTRSENIENISKPQLRKKNDARQKIILHIDDDKNILDIIKLMLKEYSYKIISDIKGANTMDLALKHRPHLIILDVMMPDVNGYELLPQLRRNPVTKDSPILILSVSSTKQKSMELGATYHITKPMNHQKLEETIHQLIQTKHSQSNTNEY